MKQNNEGLYTVRNKYDLDSGRGINKAKFKFLTLYTAI